MSLSPWAGFASPASVVVPPVPESTFRWATVTDDAPLTIRLDGETDSLPLVPDNLAGSLAVADRVWVQLFGRRVLILGKAGGAVAPGGGEEFLATDKSSPTTFSSISDVVWNDAGNNDGNLWLRDGTNVYWVCQETGTYGMKFLYATTGLTSGATRAIFDVTWAGGGTTEARIVNNYNTLTQTQSTSMTVRCNPGDKVRARVQSTMSVTLSEVNLYIVRH